MSTDEAGRFGSTPVVSPSAHWSARHCWASCASWNSHERLPQHCTCLNTGRPAGGRPDRSARATRRYWWQQRAGNRPVIVPMGLENGESAWRVRTGNQVQDV